MPAPLTRPRRVNGRAVAPRVQWLSANTRAYYLANADVVKKWRRLGAEIAKDAGVPPLPAARIVAVVHKNRGGRWDPSNLAPTAKAIVDGLVDAGVLPDDSTEYVEGPDMRAGDRADVPVVAVHVWPLDAVTRWPEPTP